MKKVDFIYPYFLQATVGPSGTMRRLKQNKQFFLDNGYDVTIYTLDYLSPSEEVYNIKKHSKLKSCLKTYIKKSSLFTSFFVSKLKKRELSLIDKYLRSNQSPDIIVFGGNEMCYYYLKQMANHKSKVILFQHSDGLNLSMVLKTYPKLKNTNLFRSMEDHFTFLIKNVDMFSFIAQKGEENFLNLNKGLIDSNRTNFFHNGINDLPCNREFNYGSKLIKLCTVGTVCRRKGQYKIVEAIASLPESLQTKIELSIIGNGDGLLEVSELIEKKSLQKTCKLLGLMQNDKIHDFLLTQDVFVLMSDNEGLPIAIIEAMRAGLAIIGTNVAGIPELVTNNGFIISPSITELTSILKNITEYNWGEMGKNSRLNFEDGFTFQKMLEGYKTLFDRVLTV